MGVRVGVGMGVSVGSGVFVGSGVDVGGIRGPQASDAAIKIRMGSRIRVFLEVFICNLLLVDFLATWHF